MELLGMPMESLYLTVLIISGCLTVLYLFFGDVLGGAADAAGILNPTLMLAFFVFMSAGGYLLEVLTALHSMIIIGISVIIAGLLDTVLHIFVLVPLSKAEESLAYTVDSLKGKTGKVIISIPEDGFGEIIIENSSGIISKPAASFTNAPIKEGTKALIIDVKKGVLYVSAYEESDLFS